MLNNSCIQLFDVKCSQPKYFMLYQTMQYVFRMFKPKITIFTSNYFSGTRIPYPYLKEYYEIVGESRPLSAFFPKHADLFTEMHF